MIAPHCHGHDATLKSEMGAPSAARAQAMLDMHGCTDRNGDGWREQPDGRPLVLRRAFTPDRRARASSELWLKRLKAVGLRVEFEFAPFGELIKRSLAGRQRVLPDGPERLALMQQAQRLMLAYVPYIAHNHPITTDLLHAPVQGPLRHPFGGDWWRWVEVGGNAR